MSNTRKSRDRFYRRNPHTTMLPHHGQPMIPDVGMCSVDQRKSYESRDLAKQVCKILKKSGGALMDPERCTHNEKLWHVRTRVL